MLKSVWGPKKNNNTKMKNIKFKGRVKQKQRHQKELYL